jgi:hypothetical protein
VTPSLKTGKELKKTTISNNWQQSATIKAVISNESNEREISRTYASCQPERHSNTAESQEISPYSRNDDHFSATNGNKTQQLTTTPSRIISPHNPIKMKTITEELSHTTSQQSTTNHNNSQQLATKQNTTNSNNWQQSATILTLRHCEEALRRSNLAITRAALISRDCFAIARNDVRWFSATTGNNREQSSPFRGRRGLTIPQ